jgi:hypothetical protein
MPPETDAAALIAKALRFLDDAAAMGDGNARYATRLLRGAAQARGGGRPPTNDADLVAKVELLGGGKDAIAAVAAGNANVAKRLKRKCPLP